MLSRSRSKDRNRKVTPPGPVYMSNDQFSDYLSNLRNNRVSRPSGARPQPSSNRRESDREPADQTVTPSSESPRSASALSHRRAQSALSNYSVTSRTSRNLNQQPYAGFDSKDHAEKAPAVPLKPSQVVPSATYMERGQRWMEKEEAVALREAMDDMDLKTEEDEETRIRAAAQDEASELVYQHQHPEEAMQPGAPYRYKDHLRKNSYQHARTQSVGRYGGIGMATGLARDIMPRSVSGESSSSGGVQSQRSRVSSDSSNRSNFDRNASPEPVARVSLEQLRNTAPQLKTHKPYGSITSATKPQGSSRRKSSVKRNISGEIAGTFTGEQIWEEPEQENPDRGRSTGVRDVPAPLRIKPKNPLNRVQFAQDLIPRSNSTPPQPTKKLSLSEIHRNPPTQSRNPAYTSNSVPSSDPDSFLERPDMPEKDTKDGLEIRSNEIRQATSMRLKDRSPKLPTPTAVSDRPGRPIVSFEKNWKPREADDKPEVRRRSIFDRRPTASSQRQSIPAESTSKNVATAIPSIVIPDSGAIEINNHRSVTVPFINLPDSAPPVPTINVPEAPKISISAPDVPTINFPDAPEIRVSAPDVPSINMPPSKPSTWKRPLPEPKSSTRPLPRHHATAPLPTSHWSLAGKRATAICHQCQLPIAGKSVILAGATEHFHPQCFICFTCGTGLADLEIRPEPSLNRTQRIDRIHRRARGEKLPDIEGQTTAEDGDERQRFFCHLDWHEHFAPRCKHCKTPIIGEHMVAMGEHFHYGHFFCAECGDPFEHGMSHIEKDGYAWCLNCQTKRTERAAPKCKKCKTSVIGPYVKALGGEWHDRCFRCSQCKGDFSDGRFFPKENGTVVLCGPCLERELKA